MGRFGLRRNPDAVVLPFFGHQVIEYLASLYLLQVGAQRGGRAAAPCYVLGALLLVAATFSGKPLGGGRLPRAAHRFIDIALIVGIAAAPFVFNFSDDAPAMARLVILAVALALLVWFTNYGRPQPGQVKAMAKDFKDAAPRLAGRAVARRRAEKRRPPT